MALFISMFFGGKNFLRKRIFKIEFSRAFHREYYRLHESFINSLNARAIIIYNTKLLCSSYITFRPVLFSERYIKVDKVFIVSSRTIHFSCINFCIED